MSSIQYGSTLRRLWLSFVCRYGQQCCVCTSTFSFSSRSFPLERGQADGIIIVKYTANPDPDLTLTLACFTAARMKPVMLASMLGFVGLVRTGDPPSPISCSSVPFFFPSFFFLSPLSLFPLQRCCVYFAHAYSVFFASAAEQSLSIDYGNKWSKRAGYYQVLLVRTVEEHKKAGGVLAGMAGTRPRYASTSAPPLPNFLNNSMCTHDCYLQAELCFSPVS